MCINNVVFSLCHVKVIYFIFKKSMFENMNKDHSKIKFLSEPGWESAQALC